MSESTQFLEIEHKFVVPKDFDPNELFAKLRALKPTRDYTTRVSDTYFLLKTIPHLVYRHRYDGMIQQLTTKSVSSRDSETRLEINLDLKSETSQSEAIAAFLDPFGIEWSGSLTKDVQVFYFDEIEIVFYSARYQNKTVNCIELEARSPESINSARNILESWELRLGLISSERSHKSLLHLLLLETLPTKLQEKLACM
jgi:adenylate cyclase class IV